MRAQPHEPAKCSVCDNSRGTIRVNDPVPYQLLADMVLSLHVAIVVFVVGGLVIIIVGNWRGWRWVNALWFRLVHLAAIAVVVAQAWLGAVCPLTSVEMWLRARARATTYAGSFIEHWLTRILYYEAPSWVFTLVYTLFGLAVVAAWWRFPPHSGRRPRNNVT
jgi:Protein of Unknown function (DUF2784)